MTPIPVLPFQRPPQMPPELSSRDARLKDAAVQFEATFIAEMLKSAGFGEPRESFGGGIGEDQFASLLRDAQAQEMAKSGGIGLAEALFEAMKARLDG